MRKQIVLAILFFSCFLTSSLHAETVIPASAETDAPQTISGLERYVRNFDQKFDRGGLNFVAGWTEIIRQPMVHYQKAEKKQRPLKIVQGFGVGLWNGIADTVGGFGNALTSLSPGWEIPLPQGGMTSEKITGGNPDAFQSEDEYKGIPPTKTPRALYVS